MNRTKGWAIIMLLVGSIGLGAVPSGERDVFLGRRTVSVHIPPISFYASRHEARIVRSIELNRRHIAELKLENRRLAYRLRYLHSRQRTRAFVRIEKNHNKILRLERVNRKLILRLRHR